MKRNRVFYMYHQGLQLLLCVDSDCSARLGLVLTRIEQSPKYQTHKYTPVAGRYGNVRCSAPAVRPASCYG